ncbi:MAG: glycosyltransferase, partial [Gemmataceae bacterium]
MILTPLAWMALAALLLALLPFLMFFRNLKAYLPPPEWRPVAGTGVSVLIPARDEEGAIGEAIAAALAAGDESINLEVVVLDDHSTDQTARIVREWSGRDSRVRLEVAPELPPGWC